MKKRLLLADDEADVRELLAAHLTTEEFALMEAEDGATALRFARERSPDLLILDLMLPGMNGLEICRALRSDPATAHLPVIMLTARAEEIDRVVGLELGADDYVTKPFSPRELLARIRNILRRVGTEKEETRNATPLQLETLVVDRERHRVTLDGEPVELTATEIRLLTLLLERQGRVQSRDQLLNEVWGYETAIETRTVDTHIRRLREKLGPLAVRVETVRGFGYRISEAP